MVRHDDVDATGLQLVNGPERARATVAGHDDSCPCLTSRLHSGGTEIVAVGEPMRNEWNGAATHAANGARQQRGGADTVDVVVAMNENGFSGANSGDQSLDRTLEIG